MARQPFKRAFLAQVKARGGWSVIFDRIASGETLAAIAKDYGMHTMILEADGEVLRGADAWLKIMTIAPWYLRWISWAGKTKFTRTIAKRIYGLVARYRYKWFGRRSCPIPRAHA